MFKSKIKLVTHNGTFHADEVFATACLKIYYKKIENCSIKVIRTRDKKDISKADVVYDVGRIYDFTAKKFDHHQEGGADKRENGIPYSSLGLIWKHFGDKLVSGPEIKKEIDDSFVQQICASDTGSVDFKIEGTDWNAWTFGSVVGLFQNDDRESVAQDKVFMKTVLAAEQILLKIIEKTEKRFADKALVEDAYLKAEDKRIIILEKGMSWKKTLIEKSEPLFVIFPVAGEKYHIQAVPVEEGSFKSRKPFPAEWRGKTEPELERITGIKGLFFVHNSGFLAGVDNFEAAVAITKAAL